MSYACSYEVPASIEMYRTVRRLIGDAPAAGMLVHLVVRSESGLRHLEVWESEAACRRFRQDRVAPSVDTALRSAGFTQMPPEPPMEELDLIAFELGS